jgi:hypothetical protein
VNPSPVELQLFDMPPSIKPAHTFLVSIDVRLQVWVPIEVTSEELADILAPDPDHDPAPIDLTDPAALHRAEVLIGDVLTSEVIGTPEDYLVHSMVHQALLDRLQEPLTYSERVSLTRDGMVCVDLDDLRWSRTDSLIAWAPTEEPPRPETTWAELLTRAGLAATPNT